MSFEYAKLVETVAAAAAAHAAATDRGAFPAATIAAMRETGLLGLISAADVGGKGESFTAAAHVVERIARECWSSAMVVMIEQSG